MLPPILLRKEEKETHTIHTHIKEKRKRGAKDLIRVGILLIGLLILLGDLLRNKQTPHFAHTAEVQSGLAVVVAALGVGTVGKKNLHTLSRASPGSLVKSSLTRLVLDARIGTTRKKKLTSGGVARGRGPVKSSLTKTVQLVDIDVLCPVVKVLLDKVILTSLGGSDETRGLSDLWATSSC